MTVREADKADYPQILQLEREYFSFPHSASQLEGEKIIGAFEGEELLGYVGVKCVLDEAYISNVAVKKEMKRQGIGDILISSLKEELKDFAFISLEVRKSNAPAIALYEKHGFKIISELKNYYSAPKEDALIMTLRLK